MEHVRHERSAVDLGGLLCHVPTTEPAVVGHSDRDGRLSAGRCKYIYRRAAHKEQTDRQSVSQSLGATDPRPVRKPARICTFARSVDRTRTETPGTRIFLGQGSPRYCVPGGTPRPSTANSRARSWRWGGWLDQNDFAAL